MNLKKYEEARAIFDYYDGSHFQMKRDDKYGEYKQYLIPKSIEMQWLQEKKEYAYIKIIECKNMNNVAAYFEKYCHYVNLRKDKKDIFIIWDYILQNEDVLDSNTLYRCVLAYIEVLRFFNKWSGKRRDDVLKILSRMLNKKISVSEDYKEDGKLPDYLNEQGLKSRIIKTLEYWSDSNNK